jgi:hypothetical protein
MKLLLTQDQQSTLWHLSETYILSNGDRLSAFPYYLIEKGPGTFDRLTFEQLPQEAKDQILTNRGILIKPKAHAENENLDTPSVKEGCDNY